MLDFAALPPEVNSARMYAGPGSGPMMAAAAAWDALAGQIESFAAGYSSELTTLQGQAWSGPASATMAAAAAPYTAWASTTAAQAEKAASQARAAAAAYEAAFAMTVPPPVIAANRALLVSLIATNFFGQNTPAIAATEAHYGEMWAQDAAAMYGYAGSSLPAAATLTPFRTPPHTTNPAGQPAQAAAAAHAASGTTQNLAHALATLPHHGVSATPSSPSGSTPGSAPSPGYYYITDWKSFQHIFNPFSGILNQQANLGVTIGDDGDTGAVNALMVRKMFLAEPSLSLLGGKGAHVTAVVQSGGPSSGSVLAGAGKAASVGQLSVPRSWANTAPQSQSTMAAQRPVAVQLANSAKPMMEQPSLPLAPVRGAEPHYAGNPVIRMRDDRNFRMPRPAVGG